MTAKPKDLDVHETSAMNTTFYFAVSNCRISNWKEIMRDFIHYAEKEWSRFQPENELARVNQLAIGESIALSPPLFDCLQRAEEYRIRTSNLFSPYLKEQLQFHGYTESFPFQSGSVAQTNLPDMHLAKSAAFTFDFPTKSITRITEGEVDLGGIGKGYAVEAAARWLKNSGGASSGIVDGGGDLTVWSNSEKVWRIGIAHPYLPEHEITQIQLTNGSIATSNRIYRSWQQGKERKHHLLNGQTGLPVESAIIQATVVTKNCLDAEVAAKLCFFDNGLEVLKNIDQNLHYFLFTNDGQFIEGEVS